MKIVSKYVQMCFKTTTVCPLGKNYLHSSHMLNTLTPSQDPTKDSSIMASGSSLRSRVSLFKSGLDVDEVCDTVHWIYSSLKPILLSLKPYEVKR